MAGTTRVLTFAEGVVVSGPSQTFLETTSFTVYAGTAAYVAAKGAPAALGDAFCDSLTDQILFFEGSVWLPVGGGIIGCREDHTSEVNGTQNQFTLSYTPLDNTILIFRNGMIVPKDKFSFVMPTVTMTDAPQLGQKLEIFYLTQGTPSIVQVMTDQIVETRTISAGEITAKGLTLTATPVDPTKVIVDIRSAPGQMYGIDYAVSGTTLSWNGYALDGVVTAGVIMRIVYYTVI
jgi:hypothetical protein